MPGLEQRRTTCRRWIDGMWMRSGDHPHQQGGGDLRLARHNVVRGQRCECHSLSLGQSSGEDRLSLLSRCGGGQAGKMGSATVDAVRFVHPCTSHRHASAQCVKSQASAMPLDQSLSVKSAVTIADVAGDRDGRLPDDAQRQLIGGTCRCFFSVHPLSVFGCVR